MAPSKVKPNWLEIKAAYQRGEGSCRELAERFGTTSSRIENRCFREKWLKSKKESEEKLKEKVVENMATEATAWVSNTLKRCNRYRRMIDAAIEQAAVGGGESPAIDPEMLDALMKSEKRVDDMARRALGLSDAPQSHSVNGQIGFVFDEAFQKKVSEAWGTDGEEKND